MLHTFDLNAELETLKNGGLILYPTDTVWSIGCDATNPDAVDKVYELKKRDRSQPFILLVSSVEMLKKYVESMHPRVETLLAYHVRPLTVIYERAINLPQNVFAPDGSIGIRVVRDEYCQRLIEAFGRPLVAANANVSGEPQPSHFGEVSSAIIVGVNHVVKHRQMDKEMNEPSVVARVGEGSELEFLRE
jgi:L-threonylcarbamoyladenylate synthase